jgi:alkylhydroperoxidase family enzyme
MAGRALGITKEMVSAMPTADASALFTDEEKAVIAAATELTRDARLSEPTFERVRGLLDERALIELIVNTSVANLNNRVTDTALADLEP